MRRPTVISKTFRPISTALAALLLTSACGDGRDADVRVEGDALALVARLDPDPPRVGDNALVMTLRDAADRPVDDAVVEASVRMPAMGAMAAMGGPAAIQALGDGRYRAEFPLAMGSTWQVEITARRGDAPPLRAEGTLTVGDRGLRLRAAARPAGPPSPGDADTHHAHAPTGDADTHHAHAPTADARPAQEPAPPTEIVVAPERIQQVGVTTAVVHRRTTAWPIRAVGRVVVPEPDRVDVSLKVRGWTGRIAADAVGVRVERGQVLFEVDSPELLATQRELIEALRSRARVHEAAGHAAWTDDLIEAARARLRLFGVAERDIDRVARTATADRYVPIRAPISGFVLEKNVVEGAAFEPGERLYRLAPLDRVWVEAEVYEQEVDSVELGASARIRPAHGEGAVLEAPVALIQPVIERASRAARVRIELANRDLALRPDTFVEVEIDVPGDAALVVPQSAVLRTGKRSFVFLALGGGRFRPQAVDVGRRVGDELEIRAGVAEGDVVVRSGTFLIAAESRLESALEQW